MLFVLATSSAEYIPTIFTLLSTLRFFLVTEFLVRPHSGIRNFPYFFSVRIILGYSKYSFEKE
jgi:hypothetical protein